MCSPCLLSVVHCAYFNVFLGDFEVFIMTFQRLKRRATNVSATQGILCLVERSNSQWLEVLHSTRTLFGHFPLSYILSFENACDQNDETIL